MIPPHAPFIPRYESCILLDKLLVYKYKIFLCKNSPLACAPPRKSIAENCCARTRPVSCTPLLRRATVSVHTVCVCVCTHTTHTNTHTHTHRYTHKHTHTHTATHTQHHTTHNTQHTTHNTQHTTHNTQHTPPGNKTLLMAIDTEPSQFTTSLGLQIEHTARNGT